MIKDSSKLYKLQNAVEWANSYLERNVTINNIMYLINYGKIAHYSDNDTIMVNIDELKNYYDSKYIYQECYNNPLSFSKYKEIETTKHVHRLHPYKGKFIPQLVEYFLDDHIDEIKKVSYFNKDDIILDPFCGSGTTLAVANELGLNAIGIDVSVFNTILSNAKIFDYDILMLENILNDIIKKLEIFSKKNNIHQFDKELGIFLNDYNNKYFSAKTYKRNVRLGNINEEDYVNKNLPEAMLFYEEIIKKFGVDISFSNLDKGFLDKWYFSFIKEEIMFVKNEIDRYPENFHHILYIILSRTARSCRATTHSDLGTLVAPINSIYYCKKHGRVCKPIFSILKWFKSYSKDTIKRLIEFNKLKTKTMQICINGDSRNMDIEEELMLKNEELYNKYREKKIRGIFTSPPYIGVIDYHEQHAYAYEIFGIKRYDSKEIGSMSDGQNKEARNKYISDIAAVLCNSKRFLVDDYDIFVVANDKYNLYSSIAEKAGMVIVDRYDRPVINRTEKDNNKYSESIFHLKEKIYE